MSLSVIVAAVSVVATAGVYGETRNIPFAGATALCGYKLVEIAKEKEKANTQAMLNLEPIAPAPIPTIASAAATSTDVRVEVQNNIQNVMPPVVIPLQTDKPAAVSSEPKKVETRTIAMPSMPLLTDTEEEEFNLPALLAESIASGINPGHILMSCKTGSGKTTTLKAMIRSLLEREEVQFLIADPKGSRWLGLESTQAICKVRESSDIANLLKWVEGVKDILRKRIEERDNGKPSSDPRIILILDEWPTLWGMAQDARLDSVLLNGLNAIVRLGREDRVNLWVVGQSHLVSDSGFNRTTQNNFELVALGRGDQLQSVRSMIADKYIVQDYQTRQKLLDQLSTIDPSGTPIAFTSSGGGRLGKLPDLRDYVNWTIGEN